MLKKISLVFVSLAVSSALADFTPLDKMEASGKCRDGYLFATGFGKTPKEARENAIIEIGNKVSASVETKTDIAHSQRAIDGIPSDINSYSERSKIVSKLANAPAVKEIGSPEPKSGDSYESKVYMCNADAAKPFLDSLRYLTVVLRERARKITKESCKSVNETYRNIQYAEGVLLALGVDFPKEYVAIYKEAEVECSKGARGVYVESSDAGLKSKIGSFLVKHGCILADEPENSALHLKLQVNEEQQGPTDRIVYCTQSVYVNLGDNKTGKGIFEDKIKVPKEGDFEMRKACEKALDKATPDIWGAFQGKIQKEQCK